MMNQQEKKQKDMSKKKDKEIRLKQEFINPTPVGEKKGNSYISNINDLHVLHCYI